MARNGSRALTLRVFLWAAGVAILIAPPALLLMNIDRRMFTGTDGDAPVVIWADPASAPVAVRGHFGADTPSTGAPASGTAPEVPPDGFIQDEKPESPLSVRGLSGLLL